MPAASSSVGGGHFCQGTRVLTSAGSIRRPRYAPTALLGRRRYSTGGAQGKKSVSWEALVAVLFWGASFVASKIALAELLPVHLILLRVSLGALALNVLLLRQGRWAEAACLIRRDWARIGLLVLISVFVHQLAQMLGLQRTTAISFNYSNSRQRPWRNNSSQLTS